MGAMGGLFAFIVLFIFSVAVSFLLVNPVANSTPGSVTLSFFVGIAREILQVWLFFSINWIPVGITASLGLANVSAPVTGVTLHLLSLSGLSIVAAVLFWTGRYCYTRTLGNVRIADAAVQSIMIGGVYGLLIAVYSFISTASISPQATVSSGGLGVNVGGSLTFGASPLEAFAVATVWGVLFSGCGILSHHVEGRTRATAMLLNLVPSARAWLTSTSSVVSSWAVAQLLGVGVMTAGGLALAADSQLHHLTSVSNLSTFPLLFCVAALLGSNLTAGGFLGGMGMPMTLSTGGSAQFGLGIAGLAHVTPILVIGQVFFSLEVFLALFIASTTTARLMHADTSRGRIALMIATPFAVLMAVLSSVALPRFEYAGKTFGLTTTSSIAVVGIAFVEAFLIANLGVWWYRRGRRVWTPHLVSRFVYTGAEIRETLDSQVPSSDANTGFVPHFTIPRQLLQRGRRFWMTCIVLVAVIPGVISVGYVVASGIGKQSPRQVAIDYFTATNSSALASSIEVSASSGDPSTSKLTPPDIAKELVSPANWSTTRRVVITGSTIHGNTASVDFRYDAGPHSVALSRVARLGLSGSNTVELARTTSSPGWKVVVNPATVTLPSLDGVHYFSVGELKITPPLDRKVLVYPGVLSFLAGPNQVFATKPVQTAIFAGSSTEAQMRISLMPSASEAAAASVASLIKGCLASHSVTPANCPNSVPINTCSYLFGTCTHVVWTADNDYKSTLRVSLSTSGEVVVSGKLAGSLAYVETTPALAFSPASSTRETDGATSWTFTYPITYHNGTWTPGALAGGGPF
jgi:hypothetical protein